MQTAKQGAVSDSVMTSAKDFKALDIIWCGQKRELFIIMFDMLRDAT
jgi:hypothetical protein